MTGVQVPWDLQQESHKTIIYFPERLTRGLVSSWDLLTEDAMDTGQAITLFQIICHTHICCLYLKACKDFSA